MTVLDRYILRALLLNYVIALAVMMSLYVVLDLFFNIDEFTESGAPATEVLRHIASYYGAHGFVYFAQLSGAITLFACMAALAKMRKANELTAVLASGVSLYRVAVPVVVFGTAASLFWYVDTEFVIPSIAHRLARAHEDAEGTQARGVWFVKDGESALLSALEFVPAERVMHRMLVIHRDANGAVVRSTEAEKAAWQDVPGHPRGGYWQLEEGLERRPIAENEGLGPSLRQETKVVTAYESMLTPAAIELRQSRQWLRYSSSEQLAELKEVDPSLAGSIRRVKHTRFATPLVHVLMVLLGLPFFLSREPAQILSESGKCVALCGLCFVTAFAGEHLVHSDAFSALPAWLPLIVFTPVGVVMLDRIRT